MKRLTHVLPLSVIGVLLFVSIAVAQSTPDQSDPNQDGVDPNAVDPAAADPSMLDPSTVDPNSTDPSTADQSAVDPSTLTAEPNAPSQTVNNVVDFRLVTIDIEPWGFFGRNTSVEPGTTVRWINMDNRSQTVTADDGSFDSGVLRPGEHFDFRFDEPGKWTYHSEQEPDKTGSITVRELTSSSSSSLPPPPPPAATEPTQPAADNAASQPTQDGTATQPAGDAATQPTDGTPAPPTDGTAAM
jgi:plastocyanin